MSSSSSSSGRLDEYARTDLQPSPELETAHQQEGGGAHYHHDQEEDEGVVNEHGQQRCYTYRTVTKTFN